MSEPIQSISQSNYILTTQQEVSHDNTLSGNGTVDSPLGVVPGYNETVLWTNTGNKWNPCTAFTLSEPISGFERIAYKAAMFNTDEYVYGTIVPGEIATANISFSIIGYIAGADGNPLQYWGTRYSTSNGLTYTRVDNKWLGMPLTGTSLNNITDSGRSIMLNGITGINRKAQ